MNIRPVPPRSRSHDVGCTRCQREFNVVTEQAYVDIETSDIICKYCLVAIPINERNPKKEKVKS